jgi:hypothetical protein
MQGVFGACSGSHHRCVLLMFTFPRRPDRRIRRSSSAFYIEARYGDGKPIGKPVISQCHAPTPADSMAPPKSAPGGVRSRQSLSPTRP